MHREASLKGAKKLHYHYLQLRFELSNSWGPVSLELSRISLDYFGYSSFQKSPRKEDAPENPRHRRQVTYFNIQQQAIFGKFQKTKTVRWQGRGKFPDNKEARA